MALGHFLTTTLDASWRVCFLTCTLMKNFYSSDITARMLCMCHLMKLSDIWGMVAGNGLPLTEKYHLWQTLQERKIASGFRIFQTGKILGEKVRGMQTRNTYFHSFFSCSSLSLICCSHLKKGVQCDKDTRNVVTFHRRKKSNSNVTNLFSKARSLSHCSRIISSCPKKWHRAEIRIFALIGSRRI